jgi:hypothetical protein
VAVETKNAFDATGRRSRDVYGLLKIQRWLQFGAGAWTDTATASAGPITQDLVVLDAKSDSATLVGPVHYGPPDPGEPLYVGEEEPQWYWREYTLEIKRVGQPSGGWPTTVDAVKAFVETTFPGETIFEANRNIERPPASNDLSAPAKWIEWELEFPR